MSIDTVCKMEFIGNDEAEAMEDANRSGWDLGDVTRAGQHQPDHADELLTEGILRRNLEDKRNWLP